MSISGLFIKRPVMTTLVMAGILLFGLVSYRNLAVSDLPAVKIAVPGTLTSRGQSTSVAGTT